MDYITKQYTTDKRCKAHCHECSWAIDGPHASDVAHIHSRTNHHVVYVTEETTVLFLDVPDRRTHWRRKNTAGRRSV